MYRPWRAIHPARLSDALKKHGVGGLASHTLRRAGMIRGRAWAGPCLLRINPVNAACNHRCPMCWLQHEPPETLKVAREVDRDARMSLSDYATIFNSIPAGLEAVEVVGGGEPLLHPEIAGICREIKRHGWRGTIYTNGTLLSEPLAHEFVAMGWDYLRVSMHAGDRETYRETQGADRFDVLLSNLKDYDRLRDQLGRRRDCRIVVFHVIQRENLPQTGALFEVASQFHADEILFHKLIAYNDAMRLTPDETRLACGQLRAGAERCSIPNNAADLARHLEGEIAARDHAESAPFRPARCCSVGFDQVFLSATGVVKPCCYSDEIMGETAKTTFRNIWQGERYHEFRSRLMRGEFASYCLSNRCSIREVLHS